jgi:hypothetical protein
MSWRIRRLLNRASYFFMTSRNYGITRLNLFDEVDSNILAPIRGEDLGEGVL